MLVICDIDGTLADWSERSKAAGPMPDKKDKKVFQRWLDTVQSEESLANDVVIPQVLYTVHALLEQGYEVVFLTGRSERFREVTTEWLRNACRFTDFSLLMRSDDDWSSAAIFKESKIQEIIENEDAFRMFMAIDDDYDGDVSKVYAKYGIVHLKVCGVHE